MKVRQVHVMRAATNALDPEMMPVTLPAAPWETGHELRDLLRSKERERVEKRMMTERMRAIAKGQKVGPSGTCRFPGCARALSAGNTSGVCRDHTHRPGYCACPQCLEVKT
jgi:hypothetical protein